jgi:peptide/nickel transport system substrate-binding protein
MKWSRFCAALLASAVLLLAACRAPSDSGKLIYGLTLAPSSIDPHVGASSELGIPLTSVYDPLVWLTPEGEYVPGLAERWDVSEGGTVYTFYLREDVEFHDGTSFDAASVCINLERIVDPATKSAKAIGLLGPYQGCEAVDEHTARVSLGSAYAPFLGAVSQVYLAMASPSALEEWGDEYQFHQVGTGPFKVQEYVPKDHLTLVRNDDYDWAPSFFAHSGPAYLQEIEFRFFVDPATRAPALEAGDVDVMGEISPPDADRLASDANFRLLPVAVPGQPFQMHLNMARPPTDDVRVRQALLYAVDRQSIVDTVFMGYSPPAAGPLNRVTWGYDAAVEALYPHDPGRAAQLLNDAGWRDADGDGIRDKDGQPLVLETILMGWGLLPEVGQVLQDQYLEVGVELNTQVLAFPAAVQAATEGQHHLIPFNFSSSDPHILRTSYHSTNAGVGFNWSKVRDKELDELLDRGMRTIDEEARANIYSAVQQRIMAEAMIVPIRDWVNLNAAAMRVKGLRYDAQGWFPWLYDVRID